ncbi:FecR family protein [Pedobacter nyackensis]|uniref:FecR family protein n=1 Tax=Pedobacter nyackensis TaxID=475255 RepID=UPI00293082EE|nr:FecR domain-containing protein [Pedobacter nyackensis]
MNQKEFEELLIKYQQKNCSEAEQLLVERWYWQYNEQETGLTEEAIEAARLEVLQKLPAPAPVKKTKNLFRLPLIAASITFIIGFSYLLLNRYLPENYINNDVLPGGYKAILVLSNGTNIDLSEIKEGEIAKDNGVDILKLPNGQLQFKTSSTVANKPYPQLDSLPALTSGPKMVKQGTGLNVVLTPKGGQYHIALPDGTNVWINAGSTLRFPSSFDDVAERRVHLTGEAYFKVATVNSVFGKQRRARKVPFIVQTDKQEVTVLGTNFNINCYPDEPDLKTSLLEGLVKVSTKKGEVILKPGMQAINNAKGLTAKKADVSMAIAWKNGEFAFLNEPLENIMRQVSRWYNVEVMYENQQMRKKPFGGSISKFKNVSQVLKMLELAGNVKFKIEQNKITVLN